MMLLLTCQNVIKVFPREDDISCRELISNLLLLHSKPYLSLGGAVFIKDI